MRDTYATSTYELAEVVAKKIWPIVHKNAVEFDPCRTEVVWGDLVECIEDALCEGLNQRTLPVECTAGLIQVNLLMNPADHRDDIIRLFDPVPEAYRRPERAPVPFISRKRKENEVTHDCHPSYGS